MSHRHPKGTGVSLLGPAAVGAAALAVIAAACASSGARGVQPPSETRTLVQHNEFSVEISHRPGMSAHVVDASIDSVWAVLGEVYEWLEIPLAVLDLEQRELGTPGYRARPIEGKRLSEYLDCGRGMTAVPYADQYEVTLSVMTRLATLESGGTGVVTVVDGSAKPRAVSGNPVHCASKGTLEARLAELVVERLGGGASG